MYLHSNHLQRGMACFSICLQKKSNSIKLYIIPSKAFDQHWMLKTFASVRSLNSDLACQENHGPSSASNSSDFLRCELA